MLMIWGLVVGWLFAFCGTEENLLLIVIAQTKVKTKQAKTKNALFI